MCLFYVIETRIANMKWHAYACMHPLYIDLTLLYLPGADKALLGPLQIACCIYKFSSNNTITDVQHVQHVYTYTVNERVIDEVVMSERVTIA